MVVGGICGCGGACMVDRGVSERWGRWLWGACMAAGHAWLQGGACMVDKGACVVGGVHGCGGACMAGGHAWLQKGVCGWGACVVDRGHAWLGKHVWLGGVHGFGGECMVVWGGAWLQRGMHRIRPDTVNERAVRILLECILVIFSE